MQWYKHYITDFDQDTADLPMLERGAYRELLEAYYQREAPLPADRAILYRLTKAHSKRERDAIELILRRYFRMVESENKSLYRNTRCDEEILKYQQQCSANRRPNRPTNRERIANESHPESTPESATELRERERYIPPKSPFKPNGIKRCITCGEPSAGFMNYQFWCEEHMPYKTPIT